jgi:hypothetical protein
MNTNNKQPAKSKKETPKTKYKDTTTETAEQRTERKAKEKAQRIAKRVKEQQSIEAQVINEIINENKAYKEPQVKRYSPDEREKIFNDCLIDISQGMSATKAVRKNKINSVLFFKWIENDSNYAYRYARAYEQRADALFDKSIDMAATIPDVNRARLVVDTLKWVAGKLNPSKYSDKQNINIISNTNNNILNLSSDEREQKILELMNKANLISE